MRWGPFPAMDADGVLLHALRNLLPAPAEDVRPLRGGCIHEVFAVRCRNGQTVVVKQNPHVPPDYFEAEAEGLAHLAAAGCVRLPGVLAVAPEGIVLTYIEPGAETPQGWEELGRALAALHSVQGPAFGYARDTYLGLWRQPNAYREDGVAFFRECRLEVLLRLLPLDRQEVRSWSWLLDHLEDFLPDPEGPVLLHGDLWSGNVHFDREGRPWLIDPAVYYGWREAELAFSRLFGPFPERFYRAYEEVRPIAGGFAERVDLYNLYPLLVHWKLFGDSYRGVVRRLLRRYAPY
nr:MAG: fructosamine kinase [Bacteroidota bacterium]